MNRYRGFTLIELMLSSALLMVILFAGYYGYSLYTQKWQKRVDYFWQGTRDSLAIDTLNKALASTIAFSVTNNDGAKPQELLYFSGTETKLRFVTNSPIISSGGAIVEVEVLASPNGYQMVYREKSFNNFVLLDVNQLPPNIDQADFWEHELVLLSGFNSITISYFGWKTFEDALSYINLEDEITNKRLDPVWYAEHNPELMRVLPENVNIHFTKADSSTDIIVKLPMLSVYKLIADMRADA